jgi:predicted PurR-regulated permease PerM
MTGQAGSSGDAAQAEPRGPDWPRITRPTRPAVVVTLFAILVGIVAYMIGEVLATFVVAGVLIVLLDPLVNRLTRWGVPRPISAIVGIVLVAVAVLVFLVIVFEAILEQGVKFVAQIPAIIDQFEAWYATAPLPEPLRAVLDGVVADLAEALAGFDWTAFILDIVGSIVGMVGSVLGLLVIPFFMFFVLSGRRGLMNATYTAIPERWRGDVLSVGRLGLSSLATYFRAEAILVVVMFTITYVGLMALSVVVDSRISEFALFLAVVAGFAELIPMFGPYLALIPAFLFGLTLGPEATIAILILYIFLMFLEGQILVPTIEGKSFAIHPAAVLVLILAGLALIGPLGAILALPVAAAGRDVFRYVFRRSTGELAQPVASPDGTLTPDPVTILAEADGPATTTTAAPTPETAAR